MKNLISQKLYLLILACTAFSIFCWLFIDFSWNLNKAIGWGWEFSIMQFYDPKTISFILSLIYFILFKKNFEFSFVISIIQIIVLLIYAVITIFSLSPMAKLIMNGLIWAIFLLNLANMRLIRKVKERSY